MNIDFLMNKLASNESDVCTNEILRLVATICKYNKELLGKYKLIQMIATVCNESTARRVVEVLAECSVGKSI